MKQTKKLRFLVNNRNTRNGIPNGIIYHRIFKPFQQMPVEVDYFWDINEIPNKDYDYLVFNRGLGWQHDKDEGEFIETCKSSGIKIIMDIDDYWELPEYHTIKWRADVNYDLWRENILNNLKRADYIWTSTEYLKTKIIKYLDSVGLNTPIKVVPNAIDPNENQWAIKHTKKYPNKVNVGYCGSLTHFRDINILQNPVSKINKHFNVQWHLTAMTDKGWGKEVSNSFMNVFTNNGKRKSNNITAWGGVPTFEYGHLYDQFDISIAPLIDNEFNRSKSELKVIEAGIKKIPFIGSDTITYSRTGANIDLCSNQQDWIDSLKDLITNKKLREELGKELNEYVLDNYSIDKSNQLRLSIL